MFKKALFCFMPLCLVCIFCSCSQNLSCSVMLAKTVVYSGEDSDGNGYFYFAEAQEGDIEYFSDELCALMYGDVAKERYFSKISDFAIFTSERTAGELAIFRCHSRSDTDEIVRMCLERADAIKVGLRGSEYEEKSSGIKVGVYGNVVAFYFVENVRRAESKLKGLI